MTNPSGRKGSAAQGSRRALLAATLLLVASAADLLVTHRILALSTVEGRELNPLMRQVIGTPWEWVVRLGAPALVIWAWKRGRVRAGFITLTALACSAVVVWNGTLLWFANYRLS